jgi:hypothetical protein
MISRWRRSRRAKAPRVAGDVLHDRDGALAHERYGHRMGAHAVARDTAGGIGHNKHEVAR